MWTINQSSEDPLKPGYEAFVLDTFYLKSRACFDKSLNPIVPTIEKITALPWIHSRAKPMQ